MIVKDVRLIITGQERRLDRIIKNLGQRLLYYLAEGPERAFVREELLQIPKDTQVPPIDKKVMQIALLDDDLTESQDLVRQLE